MPPDNSCSVHIGVVLYNHSKEEFGGAVKPSVRRNPNSMNLEVFPRAIPQVALHCTLGFTASPIVGVWQSLQSFAGSVNHQIPFIIL